MQNRSLITLVMLLLTSTACVVGDTTFTTTPTPLPLASSTAMIPPTHVTPTFSALSQTMLQNLEYTIGNVRLTLVNGTFSGQLPGFPGPGMASIDHIALGDLNNDGLSDAVGIVYYHTQNTTGHFSYLEAVESRNGKPLNVANVYLGDRENIQTVSIQNGVVVINLIAHSGTDGACCPSVAEVWQYRLQNDKWIQVDSNTHY
jgi:hypothetical protein